MDNQPKPSDSNQKGIAASKSAIDSAAILDARIRKRSKAILSGLLVLLSVLSVLAYLGIFNEVYTYRAPTGAGSLLEDQSPPFGLDINGHVVFKSTSLSAQNPIDVEVWIYPAVDFRPYPSDKWASLPVKMYAVFPGALTYPLKSLEDGDYETASAMLVKTDNPQEYYGKTRMIYQFDGTYNYAFLTQEEVLKLNKRESPTSSSISAHSYLDELKERMHPDTAYNIGSSDQTALLRNNALTLSLTLVFVALAVIELRKQITGVVGGYIRWKELRKSQT